jgi:tetratricopeptide (TPR) repeat protein
MSSQSEHGHQIPRVIAQLRRIFTVVKFNSRADVWRAKKEHDQAIPYYDEAIRLEPKFAIAHYNRGLAWLGKKEYDKAVADYNEAIRSDSKLAMAYNNRGPGLAFTKAYDKAIADYNEAIRL